MLTNLHIRNFAIVDTLDIDFDSGMTALTGETGAGKSIAIDALAIALGARADSSLLRTDSKRAEVVASFDIRNCKRAKVWLESHELDDEEQCILRRTLSDNGSKAYINGRPVTLPLMQQLAERLIDIYSQHQHQSLQHKDEQRKLLDAFAQNETLLKEIHSVYQQWRTNKDKLDKLQSAADERAQRVDYLEFQLQELETLEIKANEWQGLATEHKQLANVDNIMQASSTALDQLHENEDNAINKIQHSLQQLQSVSQFRPELQNAANLLDTAVIQLEEAVNDIRGLMDDTDADPERFQWVEQRMADLSNVARKHRTEPEQLTELIETLSEELYALKHADEALDGLYRELDQLENQYLELTKKLTESRRVAAEKLSSQVTKTIHKLGMGKASFQVELTPLENSSLSPHGMETIQFMVNTNPGQPHKPLAKIASGGELSRLSLAIQVATSQVARIPSLIFDEVDVGIGGGVAEIVGDLLRQLGTKRQILCITHQAQVAAQAHQHIKVEKTAQKNATSTRFNLLDSNERVDELARMIGGVTITDATRQHAHEMLQHAQQT